MGKTCGLIDLEAAFTTLFSIFVMLSMGSPSGASAQATTALQPTVPCASLANQSIPASFIGLPTSGAVTTAATVVNATAHLPQYCRVLGYISPADPRAPRINFQVNLPLNWNRKALQFGGSGYNGAVVAATGAVLNPPPGTPLPMLRGYMTLGSDSGHSGDNAMFALNDEALANFGHMQMKKTRDVAVALAMRYYGSEPGKVYFAGSSQGGREGLMVAQRYPNDYDGVIAEVPLLPFTGLQVAGNRAAGTALLNGGWMNAAKTRLLHAATLAACDGLDGLADGIISKYMGCNYDAAALRCPNGTDAGNGCLSDAQINAIKILHSPLSFGFLTDNDRVPGYPGWNRGGEDNATHDLVSSVMGSRPPAYPQPNGIPRDGGGIYVSGSQWIRYAIAKDPNLNTYTFDPSAWPTRINAVAAVTDATDPNLLAFFMRGGKLIYKTHGNDFTSSPFSAFLYYESVVDTVGPYTVDRSMRLYVVPGANHAGGNVPNTTNVSLLAVLENWVENGVPPSYITQSQANPPRSRPLCSYPSYPHYSGRGDPNQASSFICTPQ